MEQISQRAFLARQNRSSPLRGRYACHGRPSVRSPRRVRNERRPFTHRHARVPRLDEAARARPRACDLLDGGAARRVEAPADRAGWRCRPIVRQRARRPPHAGAPAAGGRHGPRRRARHGPGMAADGRGVARRGVRARVRLAPRGQGRRVVVEPRHVVPPSRADPARRPPRLVRPHGPRHDPRHRGLRRPRLAGQPRPGHGARRRRRARRRAAARPATVAAARRAAEEGAESRLPRGRAPRGVAQRLRVVGHARAPELAHP